jgi:hypothetical protein
MKKEFLFNNYFSSYEGIYRNELLYICINIPHAQNCTALLGLSKLLSLVSQKLNYAAKAQREAANSGNRPSQSKVIGHTCVLQNLSPKRVAKDA